jgi:uncharacterized membrane protein HdeD (DUF308 family)
MSQSQDHKQGRKESIVGWITLLRGILVIALGLSLLFIPDKTRPMLANMMGLFWISAGLLSLRQERGGRGHRLARAAAVLGIVAGVVVLISNLTMRVVPEELVLELVGMVMVLSGVVHVWVGVQVGKLSARGRTWGSTLLGIFEIVMGVLLFLHRGLELWLYRAATIWALLGGFLLISEAFRQRRRNRKNVQGEQ